MGDADTETNGDDVLIAWFVERISSSFRAKVEKINIQLGAEEARGQVLSFIHDADARRLLVTDSSGKGDVKLYTDSVPTKFKKKTNKSCSDCMKDNCMEIASSRWAWFVSSRLRLISLFLN